MRISDWSSDVCSSDLAGTGERARGAGERTQRGTHVVTADGATPAAELPLSPLHMLLILGLMVLWGVNFAVAKVGLEQLPPMLFMALRFALVAILLLPFAKRPEGQWGAGFAIAVTLRSEEQTSELQSLRSTS